MNTNIKRNPAIRTVAACIWLALGLSSAESLSASPLPTSSMIYLNSNGNMQFIPFADNAFYGPPGGTIVGNGWNGFADYYVGDWTGDGTDDMILRSTTGDMFLFPFRNDTFYGNGGGVKVGNGWANAEYFPGNWTGDGTADMLVRYSNGDVYLYPFRNNTFYGNGAIKVAQGWNFTHYFAGDWTGDGTADMIVRTSNGDLLLYPFRNNTFNGNGGGVKVGSGWNFTHSFVGNWTGDGTDDMIARDSNGNLLLFPFRNNTFVGNGGGVVVGNGWAFADYFVGDWTGDGTDDMITRSSAGEMRLYPFRNSTFYVPGAGAVIGTGWTAPRTFVGNWSNTDFGMRNTDYTEATTPTCSAEQVARFNFVHVSQLGLDVVDPSGHYIGWNRRGHYHLADDYKRTVCGQQHHYSYYNPWHSDDEADANIYLLPSLAFQGLMLDPIAWGVSNPDDMRNCDGAVCISGEITYDERFDYNLGNNWYPQRDGEQHSPLNGEDICMYGPWILDDDHGMKPEIHPSEAVWTSWDGNVDEELIGGTQTVLLGQDDSNRMDRRTDFSPTMTAEQRPWSASPRQAYVRRSFIVGKQGSPLRLSAHSRGKLNVTTGTNPWFDDVREGTEHTLTFDGIPRVIVTERNDDADLGVIFNENASRTNLHDVCKRADGKLQGFVTFRTQFGINDRGGEGWYKFSIHEPVLANTSAAAVEPDQMPSSKAPPSELDSPIDGVRVDIATLHSDKLPLGGDDRLSIIGDLVIDLKSSSPLSEVATDDGSAIAIEAEEPMTPSGTRVRLHGVNLSGEQLLRLRFSNGEIYSRRLPGIALDAKLSHSPVLENAAASGIQMDSAWEALVKSVAGNPTPRPKNFRYVPAWALAVDTKFAARKKGVAYGEDKFRVARELNRVERSSSKDSPGIGRFVQELSWSFDGELVQKESAGSGSEYSRPLRFHDAALLQKSDVNVVLRDTLGGKDRIAHTFWSHSLFGQATDLASQLPGLVAALSGVPIIASSIGTTPPRSDDDQSYSEHARRKRALVGLTSRASGDGIVTPDELKVLVAAVRNVQAEGSQGARASGLPEQQR